MMMSSQFHFKGFEPDDTLKAEAQASLIRVLDFAPFGSVAIVLLEKDDAGYRCSLDVYSSYGPFIASTLDPTARGAVAQIEKILKNQFEIWKSRRNAASGSKGARIPVASVLRTAGA